MTQDDIQARNDAFEAATPAQKRVLIAQDVLLQLTTGRLIAENGVYVRPITERSSIRETIKQEDSCRACGIGALFVAACRSSAPLSDKFHNFFPDSAEITDALLLHGGFTEEQVSDVENVFESYSNYCGQMHWQRDIDRTPEVLKLGRWQWDIDRTPEVLKLGRWSGTDEGFTLWQASMRERAPIKLRAIMENIVENNGDFLPEKIPGLRSVPDDDSADDDLF